MGAIEHIGDSRLPSRLVLLPSVYAGQCQALISAPFKDNAAGNFANVFLRSESLLCRQIGYLVSDNRVQRDGCADRQTGFRGTSDETTPLAVAATLERLNNCLPPSHTASGTSGGEASLEPQPRDAEITGLGQARSASRLR